MSKRVKEDKTNDVKTDDVKKEKTNDVKKDKTNDDPNLLPTVKKDKTDPNLPAGVKTISKEQKQSITVSHVHNPGLP